MLLAEEAKFDRCAIQETLIGCCRCLSFLTTANDKTRRLRQFETFQLKIPAFSSLCICNGSEEL